MASCRHRQKKPFCELNLRLVPLVTPSIGQFGSAAKAHADLLLNRRERDYIQEGMFRSHFYERCLFVCLLRAQEIAILLQRFSHKLGVTDRRVWFFLHLYRLT